MRHFNYGEYFLSPLSREEPLAVFLSQAADLFILNDFYDVLWNIGANYHGGKNVAVADKATKNTRQ